MVELFSFFKVCVFAEIPLLFHLILSILELDNISLHTLLTGEQNLHLGLPRIMHMVQLVFSFAEN